MSKHITVERIGARVYFAGDTFAGKDRIKALGGHWDGERRQWWVGRAKAAAAESLAAELNGPVVAAAVAVGLVPDAPAGVVADLLLDAGEQQRAEAVRAAAEAPKSAEDVDRCRVYAQVTYRDRRYYVIAETKDLSRCRLTTLDGLAPFWAGCADCELVRRYEGTRRWNGRRGRWSDEITVYPTVGSLRRFRDSQKDPAARRGQCTECGRWGPHGETCGECHEGTHL